MGLFGNQARLGASNPSGYEIDRSLRVYDSDNTYLNRTPSSTTSRTTWTLSFWCKRTKIGSTMGLFGTSGSDNNTMTELLFTSGNKFCWQAYNKVYWETTHEFKDLSAWTHIVVTCDTTNGTQADRMPVYINGARVTSFSTQNLTGSSTDFGVNRNVEHRIGERPGGSDNFNGYLAEVHFVDGTALNHTSFGETDGDTGAWVPKKYAGSYGTNGYYLDFKDNSGTTATTLGKDSSGNSNNWTPNNFSVTANSTANDSVLDTPTNNWATINALSTHSSMTVEDGNLYMKNPNSGDYSAYATLPLKAGKKYYIEGVYYQPSGSGSQCYWGITTMGFNGGVPTKPNSSGAYAFDWRGSGGTPEIHNNGSSSTTGSKPANGSVIGMAIDLSAGKMYVHDDNTYYESGNPVSGSGQIISGIPTNQDFYFIAHIDSGGPNVSESRINFGQQGFQYQPSGFTDLLKVSEITTPTILTQTDYFDTVLYTANGSSQSITSLDFQPDLVWVKKRSGSVASNCLTDSVRGTHKKLNSDLNYAENDQTSADKGMTAFLSNGFTVKDDAAGNYEQNGQSGHTYVAWCWKETASAGFDIVTYTGNGSARTISHNLGVTPEMIWVKCRSETQNWRVGHKELNGGTNPWEYRKILDQQNAVQAAADFNDTAPTSSVFSVGTDDAVNKNTGTYVAYLFAGVEGYSKAGRYLGNGDSNGPFVYTGFQPAWIILKATNGNNWAIFDNVRDPTNGMDERLHPNLTNETNTGAGMTIDFLSNGFKIRNSDSLENPSGSDVIYYAIGERSFKYSTTRL